MKDYTWSEWIKIDDELMEMPEELQVMREDDFKYQCRNYDSEPYPYPGFQAIDWDKDPHHSARITHYKYKMFNKRKAILSEWEIDDLLEDESTSQESNTHTYKITWKIAEQEMIVETTDKTFIEECLNAK